MNHQWAVELIRLILEKCEAGDYEQIKRSMEAITNVLEKLPYAKRWIPCGEGTMPPEDTEVLTTYIVYSNPYYSVQGKPHVEVAKYYEDGYGIGNWVADGDEFISSDVKIKRTAWRPLPEPWEGEKER